MPHQSHFLKIISRISVCIAYNVNSYLEKLYIYAWDTQWRSWLRHCATSRKVAGSIPDGVIGIFHWHNPSGPNMALGATQSLNRNGYQEYFLVVKAASA